LEGDGSWSTIKLVLGWILDTESLTICLPPHCVERLWEILDKILPTQRQISIKKWHKVLGELRSMSLALPGLRNIFSTMQNALALKIRGRLALDKGVRHALEDFRWMQECGNVDCCLQGIQPCKWKRNGHQDWIIRSLDD
jgi:hypothetical protein